MTTQPKTIVITGLVPSSTYEVWVRAVNNVKPASSAWTNKYTVSLIGDSVAPNTPSTPSVYLIPQGIRVKCNGKDSANNDLPPDISYYEVWSGSVQIGTMPAVTPGLGLNSESTFQVDAPADNQSKTFFVRVVDKSGNRSGPSATTSVQTIPLFTEAYIQDLSVEKLSAGSIYSKLLYLGSNDTTPIVLKGGSRLVYDIIGASKANNYVTFTVDTVNNSPHRLQVNKNVIISGLSSAYNGTYTITNVTSNTFTVYNSSTSNLSDTSGTVEYQGSDYSAIYMGTGSYYNSNTPFYVDSQGYFSLGSNLKFYAGNLEITGKITATSGDIQGTLSFAGALLGASSASTNGVQIYGSKTYIGSTAGGLGFGALNVVGSARKISIDANDVQVSKADGTSADTLFLNQYGGKVSIGKSGYDVQVYGTLKDSAGNVISGSSSGTLGDTTINGILDVSTKVNIKNPTVVSRALNVGGDARIQGDLLVGGEISDPTYAVEVVGSVRINVDQNVSGSGDLRVAGDSIFNGGASFNNGTIYQTDMPISSTGSEVRLTLTTGTTYQFKRYSSSSIRYKNSVSDIESVEDLYPEKILDIPVRAFKWNKDYLGSDDIRFDKFVPGFIAEEVLQVYPVAVDMVKDSSGYLIPESWNVNMIVPAMLSVMQKQDSKIKNLEERLAILEGMG